MKIVTIEIKGPLSALSALGIEKQLLRLPGVHTAAVNYVAGSATVGYDETASDLQTIVAWVDEFGYHCADSLTRVGVRFKACRISMRPHGYTDADFPWRWSLCLQVYRR